MENKVVIIGAIVMLMLVGGFFIFNNSGPSGRIEENKQKDYRPIGEIKVYNIVAKQLKFCTNKIEVNKGDTVILNVKSIDVSHGIAIPKLGINEFLSPGNTVRIEFVANQKGTFVFACSVSCGVGHGGMRGKIVVN